MEAQFCDHPLVLRIFFFVHISDGVQALKYAK